LCEGLILSLRANGENEPSTRFQLVDQLKHQEKVQKIAVTILQSE
jgi:hypothetical protein